MTLTREQAIAILAEREGTPPEHTDSCTTADLIAATQAPEGQPCGDCGRLVIWTDDAGWRHADPVSGCFLAHMVG